MCVQQQDDIKVQEVDFNPEFIARIIPKVDWDVLCKTAEEVNIVYCFGTRRGQMAIEKPDAPQ